MQNLPPLKAVRAFEACYRFGSFTRAAASLNVQQPAISHQIQLLEADLGVKLFAKQGTKMVPNQDAHDFYRTIAAALGDIERASMRLRRRSQDSSVVIGTYPGLANFWLLPRLAELTKQAPELTVRVTTAELDAQLPLAEVDCAILFGAGTWSGFDSALLIQEEVLPVAAPHVADRMAHLSAEDLLAAAPLIHLEDPERRWFSWDDWRTAFAPEAGQVKKAISVSNHAIAIQQALLGHGIALGWSEMIRDLLTSGVLKALPHPPLTSPRGYFFLAAPDFKGTAAHAAVAHVLGINL